MVQNHETFFENPAKTAPEMVKANAKPRIKKFFKP